MEEELDPILEPKSAADVCDTETTRSAGDTAADSAGPEESKSGELQKELDRLNRENAEFRDKYLRLHAEFDNFRKRSAKDREELRKQANERIILELLTVIDHLEMALRHASGDALENVIQGVELTLKEFERLLDSNGVKPIVARGQEFDPNIHHAMTQVVTTESPVNTVVEEFRKGYMLYEKVIRPSLVGVAAPPESSGEATAVPDEAGSAGEGSPENTPLE